MRKYLKESIALLLQLFMFYIFPLFCGPTDIMALVILQFLFVLLASFVLGVTSKEKVKYVHPIATVIVFAPTLFIYYDVSAAIYIVWHFTVSAIGLVTGTALIYIWNKISR